VLSTFQIGVERECQPVRSSRAAYYRASVAEDRSVLRMRVREIAQMRPRIGFQRIRVMLRREGWLVIAGACIGRIASIGRPRVSAQVGNDQNAGVGTRGLCEGRNV
jgi:hypothetical protein